MLLIVGLSTSSFLENFTNELQEGSTWENSGTNLMVLRILQEFLTEFLGSFSGFSVLLYGSILF